MLYLGCLTSLLMRLILPCHLITEWPLWYLSFVSDTSPLGFNTRLLCCLITCSLIKKNFHLYSDEVLESKYWNMSSIMTVIVSTAKISNIPRNNNTLFFHIHPLQTRYRIYVPCDIFVRSFNYCITLCMHPFS